MPSENYALIRKSATTRTSFFSDEPPASRWWQDIDLRHCHVNNPKNHKTCLFFPKGTKCSTAKYLCSKSYHQRLIPQTQLNDSVSKQPWQGDRKDIQLIKRPIISTLTSVKIFTTDIELILYMCEGNIESRNKHKFGKKIMVITFGWQCRCSI